MRLYNAVLVTVAIALLATGVVTYPDVPGLVLLAMAVTGVAMVAPIGARASAAVGVSR